MARVVMATRVSEARMDIVARSMGIAEVHPRTVMLDARVLLVLVK